MIAQMTLQSFIERYLQPAEADSLDSPPSKFYRGFLCSGLFDPPNRPLGFLLEESWSNGYREVSVNVAERATYTYCEGDMDLTIDDTEEAFKLRLRKGGHCMTVARMHEIADQFEAELVTDVPNSEQDKGKLAMVAELREFAKGDLITADRLLSQLHVVVTDKRIADYVPYGMAEKVSAWVRGIHS